MSAVRATFLKGLIRFSYLAGLIVFESCCLLGACSVCGQGTHSEGKRPVTVADAIGMTRPGDELHFLGRPSKERVGQFSPDAKNFVILTRKGNIERNTNEFSMSLFETTKVFRSAKPDYILTMSSSSNRDAISAIKWLDDSETIIFLGENPGEVAEIYAFNIKARHLEKLTNHPTAIRTYDISRDGHTIVYGADMPKRARAQEEQVRRLGIVITDQSLENLLGGDCSEPSWDTTQVFLKQTGQEPLRIPTKDWIGGPNPISLSPGGKYALLKASVREIPRDWVDYTDKDLHLAVTTKRMAGRISNVQQYLLLDVHTKSMAPLLDAPVYGPVGAMAWAPDGQSVFLAGIYLPLPVKDSVEREAKRTNRYDVEITIPSKNFRRVAEKDWPKQNRVVPGLEVTLEEDLNTPPRIYATDCKTEQKELLLDLNPQFAQLKFGNVKTVEWNVHGVEVIGGLYLPPDYVTGKRYPLVIQTHGYNAVRFSMDGLNEWSSGYGARPLAARGFVVLQTQDFKDRKDRDRVAADRTIGATPKQAFKNFHALSYETAIDNLDQMGVIDRGRIGISGFSRTVCFVAYTLTHTKYKFAAAVMTDGADCSYFQEMAFPDTAWDSESLNGGVSPFGGGLNTWLKESPGFNMDKVHTPLRLVALGPASVLEAWEWYAGLSLQKKPVDFVLLPDASHFVTKPWEQMVVQQGLVDWFSFWLKGEENPDPEKREQNDRWRELRKEAEIKTLAGGQK